MTILVIDAGTSSVRASLTTYDGTVIREVKVSTPPTTPAPGRVEFDPSQLLNTVVRAAVTVSEDAQVEAVGVTNQRTSTVIWDRHTGAPVGPGIGWQDTRTAAECSRLGAEGVRVAPNQSPTKAAWLWNSLDETRSRDLCVGTIDSWIVHGLSAGTAHVTDPSNAHASGFLSSDATQWNADVLNAVNIPERSLPSVVDSIGHAANATALAGSPRITAIVGDQQGSMFGQGCTTPGAIKATFGTGASLNEYSGPVAPNPTAGSFKIVAWRHLGITTWGVEAIMLSAGSCIDWLCELGVISSPSNASNTASECEDSGDVWFVPALNGLGTPWWDFGAKGLLTGITRGTGRPEVVRAVLEGIAHRGADLLEAVMAGRAPSASSEALRVDGGMTANQVFLQALANATDRKIEVSDDLEATTTGAARMAAIGADRIDMAALAGRDDARITVDPRSKLDRDRWRKAVALAGSN